MTTKRRHGSIVTKKHASRRGRLLNILAILALVAGLTHVWLHDAGSIAADDSAQGSVTDCLLWKNSPVEPTLPATCTPPAAHSDSFAANLVILRPSRYLRQPQHGPPQV